jgi:Sap, sulfolipid-1-addressing protein
LLRTLLYALLAAASPVALTATIVVLESGRARVNGLIFGVAFLVAGSVVVALVLVAGSFSVPEGRGGTPTAVVQLALGGLLIGWAEHLRRSNGRQRPDAERRHPISERMSRLTPLTALSAGALLGVGGPKRLTLGVLAAGSISAADLAPETQAVLGALYVVVASVLVWVPVLGFVIAGEPARALLEDLQQWLTARQRALAMWSLGILGTAFAVDALVTLFT